jgi:hypothetical protein
MEKKDNAIYRFKWGVKFTHQMVTEDMVFS